MSAKLNELRQKRAGCTAKAREIVDRAEQEKRDLTAEEKGQVDAHLEEHKKLGADIRQLEDLAAAERELEQVAETEHRVGGALPAPEQKGREKQDEVRMAAFRHLLLDGRRDLSGEEVRALQADVAATGGQLVAPQQWVNQLIQVLDKRVFIRNYATKFQVTSAESLGAPSLDADPADPVWTAEIKTGDEDDSIRFGKRELRPHPLAKRVKISNPLLRKSAIPVDQLVQARFAYKFGRVEENCFLNGHGVNQPLGIFVASDDGIPTSQDVSDENSATALTYNGIINAYFAMAAEYRVGARWLFHDDAVKQLVKIKDGIGRYIWLDSVRDGEPNTLLGKPVDVNDLVPHTFSRSAYVGAFCRWEDYWIADSLAFQIQVLTELYAETNQTGYIGRKETDGMPVLKNGFIRLKLAAD